MTTFPSLSSDGFIENREILSKKLFEMFLASDRSQSNYKDATSLKYILNNEDPMLIESSISYALKNMYNTYFDNTEVYVEKGINKDSINSYGINIETSYQGKIYTIKGSVSKDYYTDVDKFDQALVEILT